MKQEPVQPKELDAASCIGGFQEVVCVYDREQALSEAKRCLQCKDPTCISGCPVGINIKKFIAQIAQNDFASAYLTIREKNDFPSICGRVCPAEYQCRKACVLTKKGLPFASADAINIHFLERFAGDYGIKNKLVPQLSVGKDLSKFKVAVVGSGPAGLCCAGVLARVGVGVTVFESLHQPGGVLRYGIPPFRLPREVLDFEIDYLKKMGVRFLLNQVIGRIRSLEELFGEGYSAVFLGLGAGTPSFLNVPGENLCNIYSANEFLTRVNLMSAYKFPAFHTPVNIGKRLIVIGGGNTAIDSARVALRLQKMFGLAADTSVFYRRTEKEMPARRLEIEHARREGVKFEFLVKPRVFIGDKEGFVTKLSLLRCRLAEPDVSGRRGAQPIEGSDFQVETDMCVIAVGLAANQILTRATPALATDKYGDLEVEPLTMRTSLKAVFAGGDIVGKEGTVIEAMGQAKAAASSIIKYLESLL